MSTATAAIRMILCVIFLLLQFATVASVQRTLNMHDNVYCGVPRPSVVPVDPQYYNYFPYYVTLHRCSGSWYNWRPSNRVCAPTKYEEVKTQVYSPFSGEVSVVVMRNHTECGYECVRKPSECNYDLEYWEQSKCSCGCKYPTNKGPPEPCPEGFSWSPAYCKCLCKKPPVVCPVRQEWSSDQCGCICEDRVIKRCARKKKFLNHDSCTCEDVQAATRQYTGPVNSRMYISLLVLQSCVIVVLVSFLIHWIRKKRRPPAQCDYSKASIRDSTDPLNSESDDKKCGDSSAGSVAIELPGVSRQESNTSSVDRETDL